MKAMDPRNRLTPKQFALAFGIVQAFEPFRAPLGQADLARRLASPCTSE